MRVYFSHDDAVPMFSGSIGGRFGGAEMQIFSIANVLSKYEDVSVHFLVSNQNIMLPHGDPVQFAYNPTLISKGIPLISRVINESRERKAYPYVTGEIFVHTIVNENIFVNFERAKKHGMKFVLRLSCDADITGDFFAQSLVERYYALLQKCDMIIAQSKNQARLLMDCRGLKGIVIPNGLPDAPIKGTSSKTDECVLWIGRCVNLKRPWDYLELARRNSETKFVMFLSDDDNDLKKWIKDSTKSISNLEIVENVSNDNAMAFMNMCKLYINTSSIEGFPNTFIEAMRASVPIASLSVDPDSIIRDNKIGIVGNNDMETFNDKIKNLLDDESELKRMGHSARNLYETNYTVHTLGEKYHRAFRELLCQR